MKRHRATSTCTRCGEQFGYFRAKKPRIYCRSCRVKERREAIAFHNATYYALHKDIA